MIAIAAYLNNRSTNAKVFAFTPGVTARGLAILTIGVSTVTSVSYGGVPMVEVPLSGVAGLGTVIQGWFLGSGVLSGTQNMVIVSPDSLVSGFAYWFSADTDTEVVDTATVANGSIANPAATLALTGRTCASVILFISGHDDIASVSTISGSWTARTTEDLGASVIGSWSGPTGSADVSAGWLQTAEGAYMLAMAPSEVDGASAAVTGTAGDGATEAEIVAGGGTIVLTVTGDTFVAAGATFDAQRQAIIDGIDSAQAEANGWDATRSGIAVTDVVRTSDTVVTITLPALASYAITSNEALTVTIPGAALTGAAPVVASPIITITATSAPGTAKTMLVGPGNLIGQGPLVSS